MNLAHEKRFNTHISGCPPTSRWYVPFWDSWLEKAKTDEHAQERVHAYQWRAKEEFFDLETDPLQMKNLADDPAHAERMATMCKALTAWCTEQDDREALKILNSLR